MIWRVSCKWHITVLFQFSISRYTIDAMLSSLMHANDQYIYRLLNDDEDPKDGLSAKDPKARKSVEEHVSMGSKPGFKSQFISATSTYKGVYTFAMKKWNDKIRIAKINITESLSLGVDIVINTNDIIEACESDKAINFARKFDEVLIIGFIPSECLELIVDGKKADMPAP